jgi:hypothetical protein
MEEFNPHGSQPIGEKMSARIYPDVSIFLTLDYEQEPLLRKCTIFQNSVQKAKIDCYMLSTVRTIRDRITNQVIEAGGNSLRGLWHHLSMNKRRRSASHIGQFNTWGRRLTWNTGLL